MANCINQTVKIYTLCIEGLMNFLNELPENLDMDRITNFLNDFKTKVK